MAEIISHQKTIRLFWGIPVSETLACDWKDLILAQQPDSEPRLRMTVPGCAHITVRFLGNVPAKQLGALKEIGEQVGVLHAGFLIEGDRLDYFPKTPAKIIAAYLRNNPQLGGLFEDLGEALEEIGFDTEKRAYRPHVTLARLNNPKHCPINTIKLGSCVLMARELILYQSLQTDGRTVYVPLYRMPLRL